MLTKEACINYFPLKIEVRQIGIVKRHTAQAISATGSCY